MKNKVFFPIALVMVCISLGGCGNDKQNTKTLYNELLQKVVVGEEMFSDEGEGYGYSDAEAPGYALYDIDKDGIDELFITPRMESEWHTYTVYYIKDGAVTRGKALNGYLPKEDVWTYAFDFFIEAYEFNNSEGFIKHWELDYPWVDGYEENTLYYEDDELKEISDEEVNELLEGHITEPADVQWKALESSGKNIIR